MRQLERRIRQRRTGAAAKAARAAGVMPRILADKVEWRPRTALRPSPNNPRTHSDRQIAKLGASIQQFGFTAPILVDEAGFVLAGHGRLMAAKKLGLDEVPTLRLDGLTPAQKRAYVIADNKLAQLAGWDSELLKIELKALVDLDFEVELTGFDTGEIDQMLDFDAGAKSGATAEEVGLVDRSVPAVTRRGDLWELGPHRLSCGDALDRESYELVLGAERAQMVITDPPYNVRIDGHVCGLGRNKHREFAMAAGEMTDDEFGAFLSAAMARAVERSADGSIHYWFMDWRHIRTLLAAGERQYEELKNLVVWAKTNAGMGAFYRSGHELVAVFKKGKAKHINSFGLGEKGRYRTNVWSYPGVNVPRRGRNADLEAHPTVKPSALVADAMRDCSKRGGLILDPFGGSGTTILAAERTGRVARVIELDPAYVDVAIRRWEERGGKAARLVSTGQTFAEVERRRRRKAA